MYFVSQCSNFEWMASMSSKASDLLRKHVINTIKKVETTEDVYVFGGIIRRTIFANDNIKKFIEDPDFSTKPQSIDCFVSQRADIDIRVQSMDDSKKIENQLNTEFLVTSLTLNNLYNGCQVIRLSIKVRHSLLARPVKIKVDLVYPDVSYHPLLPDFDVNQLQICIRTGQLTLSPISNLHWMFSDKSVSFLGGEQSDFFIIQRIHESIYEKKAKLMLLRESDFVEMFKSTSKKYYEYLRRILEYRLPKMLKDGWIITNLVQQTVRCEVDLTAEYRFNDEQIEIPCKHCKDYIKFFENFCCK